MVSKEFEEFIEGLKDKSKKDDYFLPLINKESAKEIKDGRTLLHYASQYGLRNAVEKLLDNHADEYFQDEKTRTSLMIACEYRHPWVVHVLLKHKTRRTIIRPVIPALTQAATQSGTPTIESTNTSNRTITPSQNAEERSLYIKQKIDDAFIIARRNDSWEIIQFMVNYDESILRAMLDKRDLYMLNLILVAYKERVEGLDAFIKLDVSEYMQSVDKNSLGYEDFINRTFIKERLIDAFFDKHKDHFIVATWNVGQVGGTQMNKPLCKEFWGKYNGLLMKIDLLFMQELNKEAVSFIQQNPIDNFETYVKRGRNKEYYVTLHKHRYSKKSDPNDCYYCWYHDFVDVDFVNVHFQSHGGDNVGLLANVNLQENRAIVIAGDFNCNKDQLKIFCRERRVECDNSEEATSSPKKKGGRSIDHILFKNLTLLETKVFKFLPHEKGDHYIKICAFEKPITEIDLLRAKNEEQSKEQLKSTKQLKETLAKNKEYLARIEQLEEENARLKGKIDGEHSLLRDFEKLTTKERHVDDAGTEITDGEVV
ncbi:Ankfy1 [Acrasis kona]|uniref:Ankfy1 n=1 Tax=Acrasis kona TaxID=1008807 RepID=A0AAW2Z6M6_9EUKA